MFSLHHIPLCISSYVLKAYRMEAVRLDNTRMLLLDDTELFNFCPQPDPSPAFSDHHADNYPATISPCALRKLWEALAYSISGHAFLELHCRLISYQSSIFIVSHSSIRQVFVCHLQVDTRKMKWRLTDIKLVRDVELFDRLDGTFPPYRYQLLLSILPNTRSFR